MANPKYKFNKLDIFIFFALFLILLVIGIAWGNKPYLGDDNLLVVVKINDTNTIDNIMPKVEQAKKVCIDSERYCADQISAMVVRPNDGADYVAVTLKGLGYIKGDKFIFLGHKIYANQEVQLRGDYLANGRITDFYYEE